MTLSGVLAMSTSFGALVCTSFATLFSLAGGMEVGWFSAGTPGSPAGSDMVLSTLLGIGTWRWQKAMRTCNTYLRRKTMELSSLLDLTTLRPTSSVR